MATRANTKKQWRLGMRPPRFKVSQPKARFAIAIIMGADGDLVNFVAPDLMEMILAYHEEISVVLLVDLPGDSGSLVMEVVEGDKRTLEWIPEFSTGDPRPLSYFLASFLVSYTSRTRFALGFWGHGSGIYADYDAHEVLFPALLRRALPPRKPLLSPRRTHEQSMLPDVFDRDRLTNREARSAIGAAFLNAGRRTPVDIIFSDTCLNGAVEVYTELREFTKVVIASSMLVPGTGWDYKRWLNMTAEERPAMAEHWAVLAVDAFAAAYPQGEGERPAQLAAFSTEGPDIVKAFARITKVLLEMPVEHADELLSRAFEMTPSVRYEDNRDLRSMVNALSRLSFRTHPKLREAARAFLDAFDEALLALSPPPPDGRLAGLTLWCPTRTDPQRVSRTYGKLEFAKKTKWLKLLQLLSRGHDPVVAGS